MLNVLASPGLMHLALDFTQELAILGIGLASLFVLSGTMILVSAISQSLLRPLAHGH